MEHCQSFVVSSSSYSGGTGRTTITPTADLESGGTSSGNGTLYTCPSSYNCVFEMAASAAITVTAGTVLGEFTGVCIQGNATTPGHGLVVEQGSEISASENLVIRDCDEGLRVAGRSGLYATTPVVHGNASHGFHLLDRSFARFTDGLVSCQNGGSGLRVDGSTLMIGYSGSGEGMKHAVSDGNANKGLFCFAGGMATAGYLAGSHNGAGGIEVATGSTVNAPWSCLRMNAKGVVASGAARALCAYSRVVGNANDGVKCTEGSFVNVASGNCSYNTGDGILCQDGASVKADTVTATNNDKGVVAEDGSFVNAGSGTVSSNTTDNFSPTANSVGNSNSYIKN
jgi:hypothetical protein